MAIEEERAVLGSLLLDRDMIARVAEVVAPSDFYRDAHATVYAAMVDLFERDVPIDYLTLVDRLEQRGELERIGGVGFLSSLLGAVPTPIHAPRYAAIIARTAYMRRLVSVGGRIASLAFRDDRSEAEAQQEAERLLFEAAGGVATRDFLPFSDILAEYLDGLARVADGRGLQQAVPTGFKYLDQITNGGFGRSNLVVLAARPAMGKTSLCLSIAASVCRFGGNVCMFSLEMSRSEIVGRILSAASGIALVDLKRPRYLGEAQQRRLGRALEDLPAWSFWLDDTPGLSITTLKARAKRLAVRAPLDMVVVDHLQLLTGSGRRGENRVQEMSEISRELKALARELNCPVVALSQLNRAVELRKEKIPTLADLRESGAIEQDADLVLFIYRDAYYNPESERVNIADLYIGKQRNGETGKLSLFFSEALTRFSELEQPRV